MKYVIRQASRFTKDVKRIEKRGYKLAELAKIIDLLASGDLLPVQYRDHALSGDYAGFRECHIRPDWLLIYLVTEDILVLTLTRTGTHSDLF